jgi:diacylglycerol kinase (ATP)
MRIWGYGAISVRVTLIHNPGAGKGECTDQLLLGLLRGAGHKVRYQSSKEEGWQQALKDGADLVAVAGGDGTVARVAKRLVGRGIPVAPLPLGTANNISRSLGLHELSLEEIVRSWANPRRVKLDIGVVEGPWGPRYFVEGVGVGLFAGLLAAGKKDKKLKNAPVEAALRRLQNLAKRCQAVALEASLDRKALSGRFILFEALNIPYIGSNLFLAPDSQPGDGQFDVVLVSEAERERLVEYLAKWRENRERLAVLPSQRGKRLRIKWTGFDVHIDDKLWPKRGKDAAKAPGTIEARIAGAAVEVWTC